MPEVRMPGKVEIYWTTEDVASRLHVSKATVKRWTGGSDGRLKKVKAGDKTLITESAIQEFIAACTQDDSAA